LDQTEVDAAHTDGDSFKAHNVNLCACGSIFRISWGLWGSRSGIAEDRSLLVCDAVSFCQLFAAALPQVRSPFMVRVKLHPEDYLLEQCFWTVALRPGTGPWHQLYRAARGL